MALAGGVLVAVSMPLVVRGQRARGYTLGTLLSCWLALPPLIAYAVYELRAGFQRALPRHEPAGGVAHWPPYCCAHH
ncbi:MAG: hypothetical protein ACYCO3_15255 [Mycobacteriales bacterium]